MNVKELCVGNYVYFLGIESNPMHVEGIDKELVYFKSSEDEEDPWGEDITKLQPIPLTIDILIKSGGKRVDAKQIYFVQDKDIVCVLVDNDEFGIQYVTGRFKFVHQFQNLMFHLFGRDIEIKL